MPAPCWVCPTPESMIAACRRVIADGLTVRQTEALVATGVPTPSKSRIRKDQAEGSVTGRAPHFIELEAHLKDRFGTIVAVRSRSKDRGQIVIDYNSQEEYERVVALIRGS